MAMRRRIKVGVNLTAAKRKPKPESRENTVTQEVEEKSLRERIKAEAPQNETFSMMIPHKVVPKIEPSPDTHADDAAFKCPPKVEFHRSNSYTTAHNAFDEHNQTDIDDGAQVMQMDLQRTGNGFPMSPSKTQRQRIKPTPIFGQRRNSLVGTPPSPLPLFNEDATDTAASPQRRERHFSGSQSHVSTLNHIAAKPSHGTGRIRTESTCSVFSDSHMSTTSKSRKIDDHSSHRTHTRRDFEARFSNGVPDKSNLKMFDLIYYNPITNPMEQKPKIEEIKTEAKEEEASVDTELQNNDNSAVPVPQLKLNAKGELILDDKSLEIETTAEQEARKVLAKSSLIYLDENTGMNGFYKRQKRTKDWAPDETIRFYRCLQTIGTDFSMMCQLFPKRTRRDLKLKFKKEERCNGALINKALLHPNSFNIQELKDQFEIEDRQREEEERTKSKYLKSTKPIQYKKVNIKTSISARALKNADDIYDQELRDVQANKKKKQRKGKNTNKTEVEESKPKEIPKRKGQARKAKEAKSPELLYDVETHSNPMVKNEPLHDVGQQNQSQTHKELSSFQHNSSQVQMHKSMITPDEPLTEEVEYVELLSIDANEGDHATQSDYMNDYDDIHEENQFIDEADVADSRTFVNMDSGNVTLIRDIQTLYSDVDDPNVRLICNGELMDNDIPALSQVISPDEEATLLPLIANDSEILYSSTTAQQSPSTEYFVAEESEAPSEKQTLPKTSIPNAINDEIEIQKILEDIANGSLVVVTTYNPASPDDLINEIYMLDRSTGEIQEEPLDLPQELIQSILSVMT